MRVLVFGAWDDGPGYPRTRAWLQGLDATGLMPVLWRLPSPWRGRKKIDVVRQPWRWPGAVCDLVALRARARRELRQALAQVCPDVVLVPYPGHLLVPLVRKAFAGPVVLDLFLPAYDTAVEDRRLLRPGSWPGRVLRRIDARACAAADLVLLDTATHADHVARTLNLPPERVSFVPVGDPDAPAVPPPYPALAKPLRVLFFGTGVPLHGLPVLVAAVRACAGAVRLTVVGASRAERAAIARLPCAHVELGPLFANRQILAAALADCHVVAGVFGATAKAQRVVPFKVVHGLAAGRPVLTADTPALREFLTPGHDVLVAPAADVMRLAQVLRDLAASPDRLPTIAHHAHAAFTQHFAAPVLGAHLRGLLTAALAAAAAPAADDLVLAR